MKVILELINIIESSILEYDIKELMKKVTLLVEELIKVLPRIDEEYIKSINNIFYNINIALINKDYLLYNDILQYELKPILQNMIQD